MCQYFLSRNPDFYILLESAPQSNVNKFMKVSFLQFYLFYIYIYIIDKFGMYFGKMTEVGIQFYLFWTIYLLALIEMPFYAILISQLYLDPFLSSTYFVIILSIYSSLPNGFLKFYLSFSNNYGFTERFKNSTEKSLVLFSQCSSIVASDVTLVHYQNQEIDVVAVCHFITHTH